MTIELGPHATLVIMLLIIGAVAIAFIRANRPR